MTSFRVEIELEVSRSTTRKHGLIMATIIAPFGRYWQLNSWTVKIGEVIAEGWVNEFITASALNEKQTRDGFVEKSDGAQGKPAAHPEKDAGGVVFNDEIAGPVESDDGEELRSD